MVLNINGAAQAYLADLNRTQQQINQAQAQVTSGFRVQTPSDDPAAVPSILQVQAEIGSNHQIQSNLGSVTNELGTADSALQSAIQAEAGADALELNLYALGAHDGEPGFSLERRFLEIVRSVKAAVRIPVAVKLSPFFSSLGSFASELDGLSVDGLVLFNRFYQPDIDPETLDVTPVLRLSTHDELLLRLRWLAMLSGRVKASLAVTGGVHDARDAIKAIMAGADAVQMVSALLLRGPKALAEVRADVTRFLEEHEYKSLAQMKGSMSLLSCPDPAAYERANYARVLQSYKLTEPTAI